MIECQPSLLESGTPAIAWIANHLRISWLTPLIKFISDLGTEGGVIFTLALAYWFWNKRYATYLGYALFTALLINLLIKGWVMECRPPKEYWLEMIRDDSFSFPSGHAQVATPLWLGFAYYVRHKGLALFYCAIGLIIAISRPYLGVHFLHDIGFGVLLGSAIYAVFIVAERKHWDPLQRFSLVTQALILFLLIALYLFSLHVVPHNVVPAVASLIGFWFGCQCETRWVQFSPPAHWRGRLRLLIIGIVGIGLFWKGFALLGKPANPHIAVGIKILQYSLLSWWVIFAAPTINKALTR